MPSCTWMASRPVSLATNPDVQVNVNYIGSFSDTALAAEAATTHIAAGADVMTGTAQMVVGAIGQAQESNVLWFGTQSNQTSLAPSIVVASQVYHWEVVLDRDDRPDPGRDARRSDLHDQPGQWRRGDRIQPGLCTARGCQDRG